jgi:hypothetical protein
MKMIAMMRFVMADVPFLRRNVSGLEDATPFRVLSVKFSLARR